MISPRTNPRLWLELLLIMLVIPGVGLLISFLLTPSEMGNQFLFGFSKARFAVVVVFSLLVLLNIGALWLIRSGAGNLQRIIEDRLTTWIFAHPRLVYAALRFVALFTGLALLILIPPVVRTFAFLEPVGRQTGGFLLWLFLASSLLPALFRITYPVIFQGSKLIAFLDRFLFLAVIFLSAFFLYEHILIWTGAANQTRYSYWNLLADEFLQGRLYLQHPPQTHDLTLYDEKWYVPMPPIPAILMMPLAYWIGGENINTQDLSIALSAINIVLLFLILEQLNRQKWIRVSKTSLFLLLVLFAFGTPHLWVGIRGRAWFVSQILTVTFLALAVFAALKSWSPWLVGLSLGIAIAARPNAIMTWPFVFAIAMQMLQEKEGRVTFRQTSSWTIRSALPMLGAVAGLLLYNEARFDNFFDFGYVTISGDPTIVANAKTYGIFSLHFIPANLKAMFLYFPLIQPAGRWPILPSTVGMSIFLTTPPLIYLFHRY